MIDLRDLCNESQTKNDNNVGELRDHSPFICKMFYFKSGVDVRTISAQQLYS